NGSAPEAARLYDEVRHRLTETGSFAHHVREGSRSSITPDVEKSVLLRVIERQSSSTRKIATQERVLSHRSSHAIRGLIMKYLFGAKNVRYIVGEASLLESIIGNRILFCGACEKTIGSEKRFQIVQHINTAKHKENLTSKLANKEPCPFFFFANRHNVTGSCRISLKGITCRFRKKQYPI
ncbi:hypothetical protein C0J52_19949, partial [Blattella germanica]